MVSDKLDSFSATYPHPAFLYEAALNGVKLAQALKVCVAVAITVFPQFHLHA